MNPKPNGDVLNAIHGAIAWMKRAPFPAGAVLNEPGDLAPALTPDLREQDKWVRAQAAAQKGN
jgi:hypothetical protein